MPTSKRKTHRDDSPEQHKDPLVGRRVVAIVDGEEKARGKIAYVFTSPVGKMVSLDGRDDRVWPVKCLEWEKRSCRLLLGLADP